MKMMFSMLDWSGRRRFAWIAVGLLIGLSPAANGQGAAIPKVAGTDARTVSHLGIERQVLLHLPGGKTPEKRLPLVIALHGAFTDHNIMEELTGLSDLAEAEGFAVAYPNANPAGKVGIWEFWTPPVENPGRGEAGQRRVTHGRDDVGFIAALMDALVDEGIADPRRIYVTGISNGAFLANRLAIDLGDRIAAIAPVAGTGLKIGAPFAKPKRPMPVIYFHGTGDKIVGVDGSDAFSKETNSLSADELTAWWVAQNGSAAEPVTETLPDTDKKDGCTVERLTWTEPNGKAPVIYYRILGGGHSWSGGSESQPKEVLGNICRDMSASPVIWEFFSKHLLPEKP